MPSGKSRSNADPEIQSSKENELLGCLGLKLLEEGVASYCGISLEAFGRSTQNSVSLFK